MLGVRLKRQHRRKAAACSAAQRPSHAHHGLCRVPWCRHCRVFEQRRWARQQIESQPDSVFWRLLGLLEQQFMGMVDGYQVRPAS